MGIKEIFYFLLLYSVLFLSLSSICNVLCSAFVRAGKATEILTSRRGSFRIMTRTSTHRIWQDVLRNAGLGVLPWGVGELFGSNTCICTHVHMYIRVCIHIWMNTSHVDIYKYILSWDGSSYTTVCTRLDWTPSSIPKEYVCSVRWHVPRPFVFFFPFFFWRQEVSWLTLCHKPSSYSTKEKGIECPISQPLQLSHVKYRYNSIIYFCFKIFLNFIQLFFFLVLPLAPYNN